MISYFITQQRAGKRLILPQNFSTFFYQQTPAGKRRAFNAWPKFRVMSLGCTAEAAPQICYLTEADPTRVP
jgi:hypothetical protein